MNNTTVDTRVSWIMSDGSIGSLLSRWLQNSDYQGQTIGFNDLQHIINLDDTHHENNPAGFAPITGAKPAGSTFPSGGVIIPPAWAI
jgi:hypothetical protein